MAKLVFIKSPDTGAERRDSDRRRTFDPESEAKSALHRAKFLLLYSPDGARRHIKKVEQIQRLIDQMEAETKPMERRERGERRQARMKKAA